MQRDLVGIVFTMPLVWRETLTGLLVPKIRRRGAYPCEIFPSMRLLLLLLLDEAGEG